ncbi:hypothetical protein [Streptomyces sp. NPDC056304]|uniref:hypothetical protein n=1 Tax=Streptomyces sp. NPDC056304 TaxID=3345778 RepID=UPI0035D69B44
MQDLYDEGRSRLRAVATGEDPAADPRARADAAAGFLAVPAADVRQAFAGPELTLGQRLGACSLGVLPSPPDRLPADDAEPVVLYTELSAVAARQVREPTWPIEIEGRIPGRTAAGPHVVGYMP